MSTLSRLSFAALLVALTACSSSKTASDAGDNGDTGLIPDTSPDVGLDAEADTAAPEVGVDATTDVPTEDTVEADTRVCETSFGADMDTDITLVREARIDLRVALEDCDGPVANAVIDFDFAGDIAGAELRNTRARTDEAGEAVVELVVGDTDTAFQVVATDGTDFVTFDITVSGSPLGGIAVEITDATEVDSVTSYSAYLFTARGCSSIHRFDPLGALEVVEPITSLVAPTPFDELAPAGNYTVAVQAQTDTGVIGFGCMDGLAVVDRETTEVAIEVALIPPSFDGIYELDNRFDLADVLPDSIASTLRVLDELTDDEHVSGSAANDSWGVDPAAFILDFIFSEICCWTAIDTDPIASGFQGDFDTCSDQDFTHPLGDLEMLYRENFSTWDGAQPSIPSLCGFLEVGNETVQTLVQDLIEDNVPDVALNLIDIVGDLSRAITDMHVISELRVGDVSIDKIGQFTHILREMHVELHDLDGEIETYVFLLTEAGLENLEYTDNTTSTDEGLLNIPEHSFRLDFGRLLRYVFTDILLPTLECDRDHDGVTEPCTSTADLFGTWIDCQTVGAYLEEEIGVLTEATYVGICNSGVDTAGDALEITLEDSVSAETILTLTGTVRAGELDDEREALTLVDGQWDGQLVEDETSYGAFLGVFTGVRTRDLD